MSSSSSSSSSGSTPPPNLEDYYPTCDCCCDCYDGASGERSDQGQSGGGAGTGMAPAFGMVKVSAPGIPVDPFNMGLGNQLEYASRGGSSFTQYGKNWMPHDMGALVFSGSDVIYQEGPRQMETFLEDAGDYTATAYVRSTLKKEVPGGGLPDYYIMTLPDGERRKFDLNGKLEKIYNPYGKEAEVYWSGDKVSHIMIDHEMYAVFTYHWTAGRLQSITYSLNNADVRRVSYQYTASGELEKVIQEEPGSSSTWTAIETTYYGYHPGGDGLLKYVLGNEAYDRWQSSGGSTGDLSDYADYEYAYNSTGTVSQVKAKGCKYLTNYSYDWDPGTTNNINHWANKIIETRQDGTVITYYTNYAGELILKKVTKGADTWYPIYQQFETGTGRVTLQAENSAIASVNEATATLVTLKTNAGLIRTTEYDSSVTLKTNAGLIRTTEYDSSAGLKSAWYIQEGSSGTTKAKLGAITYLSQQAFENVPIYKPYQQIVYRSSSATGSDGVITTHNYTWHQDNGTDTYQIANHTVTLPAVSIAQNGTGVAATTETHFDEWGFKDKEVDERGIVTKYTYNRAYAGMTEMILNYVESPPTPEPPDMNLTTNYQVDVQGRTTRQLGPAHTIDLNGTATEIRSGIWTRYLDASDEVVTIQGYQKTSDDSDHTINPVQIAKNYEADTNGTASSSTIAAEYTGTGIPAATHDYVRSSWKHCKRHVGHRVDDWTAVSLSAIG